MQAFIPSAGLGTRLRPLTNDRPKALVEIEGVTLLEINILRMIEAGAKRIVVNVHHFSDKVKSFLDSKHWESEIMVSDEHELLMDTGGGLKKAESLFLPDEPILIHNVDVLTHLDLEALVDYHLDSKSFATLCVSERNTSRYLLADEERNLIGWTNEKTGEILWSKEPAECYSKFAFSGIAVVDPLLLSELPAAIKPYPIIPEYLRLADDHTIKMKVHAAEDWLDVGKPETLPQAETFLSRNGRSSS